MISEIHSKSSSDFGDTISSLIIQNAIETIKLFGNYYIAIPGGKMPIPVFDSLRKKALKADILDWSRVHIFWLDDRFVPHNHNDSNFKLFKDHFLQYNNEVNYYPIPYGSSIDKCSENYERTICKNVRRKSHSTPSFDLILIGIGDDGHIASLFPNSDELHYKGNKKIIPVLNPPFEHRRITFTIELLNAARSRIIGIKGTKKVVIFNKIKSGVNNNYPLKFLLNSNSKDLWVICNE